MFVLLYTSIQGYSICSDIGGETHEEIYRNSFGIHNALGLTACAGGGSDIHRLNMATGGDAGTYYAFGGVIASVLTSKNRQR